MKKFILGIATIICFIPISESLTELICGFIEVLKGKNTKKVMLLNKEIQELEEYMSPQYSNCIGFQMPEEYYEEYDDDEFEEDKSNSKIGFCYNNRMENKK